MHQNVDPSDNSVPMSVWWQVPQYFAVGMAEVFASVGALEFFYSQSPEAMRSMASALNLIAIAMGSYLSTGLVRAGKRTRGRGSDSPGAAEKQGSG